MTTLRQLQIGIGLAVLHERQARKWTLRDLGVASQVTKGALSKIESGNGNPCLNTITKIAAAFGLTEAELLRIGDRLLRAQKDQTGGPH